MKYLLSIYREEQAGPEDPTPEADARDAWSPGTQFNRELIEADAFMAGDALQPSATATTVDFDATGEQTGDRRAVRRDQGAARRLLPDRVRGPRRGAGVGPKVPDPTGERVEVRPAMDLTQFGYEDPGVRTGAAS